MEKDKKEIKNEKEVKDKNKKSSSCIGKSHKMITSLLFTTILILIIAISFASGFLMSKYCAPCNTDTVINTVEKIKEEEQKENTNDTENVSEDYIENYIELNVENITE